MANAIFKISLQMNMPYGATGLFLWCHIIRDIDSLLHANPLSLLHPPLHTISLYKDFPMNFLFVKLNHHLLGVFVPSEYTLFSSLTANSCRTCMRYCLSVSAWLLSVGASKAWLRGKPASPGIAKLVSRAMLLTA